MNWEKKQRRFISKSTILISEGCEHLHDNKIYLKPNSSKRVKMHEYGHLIFSRLQNGKDFCVTAANIFEREAVKKNLTDDNEVKNFIMCLLEKYTKYDIEPITDGLYMILGAPLVPHTLGHDALYCRVAKKCPDLRGTEMFAEVLSAYITGESSLEPLKKFFPKTYYYVLGKIKGLMK